MITLEIIKFKRRFSFALVALAVIWLNSTALAATIIKQDKSKILAYEIEHIRMYLTCTDTGNGGTQPQRAFFDFDAIPLITRDRVVWIPLSIIQRMTVKKSGDGFRYTFVLGDGTKLKGFTAKKYQEIGIGKNYYFIGASDFGNAEIQARSVKEIVFNAQAEKTYNAKENNSQQAVFIPTRGQKTLLNSVHFFCIEKNTTGCILKLFASEKLNIVEKGNLYQIPLDHIVEIQLDQDKDPSWRALRVISTKGNKVTGAPQKARYVSGVQQIGGYRLNVMIPLEYSKRAKIIIHP